MSDLRTHEDEKQDHEGVDVFIDDDPFHFDTRHTTGREIKERAGIPDDYSLYLRREGENEPIRDDEEVHLHEGEHFFSEQHHEGVDVFIDDDPYHFDTRRTTGREIKERAGIPDDHSLYLRREGENEPIRDDEEVHLHEGEHFFSRPPSNVS